MDFTDLGAVTTMEFALGKALSTPAPSALYIKLHVGDPGKDALGNPAVETTRQLVIFDNPVPVSTDGHAEALTTADVLWVAVAATETYSHMSIWDDLSAGNPWYKGAVVAPIAVTAGSNFKFDAGSKLDHV
ncbi:MAG: hypothetical protein DRQ40_01730 [Gammaproteobacteria bacterium]|nr:MAG: hypothetical protein DRQ40_01730 [Gammaproteobacteria bacterium]